ncbi:MAG: hypothetical protein H0U55_07710 [Rubrobacteraceae bacterium]|nr:hypothetical protein [Rubrobacteraceae bacterium]
MDTRGNWSQRNQRSTMTFRDQHCTLKTPCIKSSDNPFCDHGREYFATIEIKTGHTVGLIEKKFTAPLMPSDKYLERIEGRPYNFLVNYDRWISDEQGARSEWERDGRVRSRQMHGDAYDPAAPFTSDVLDIIGPPPNAIEPLYAAQQGNAWILGLTPRVDIRLVKFFEPEQLPAALRAERIPDFSQVVDGIEEDDFHDLDPDEVRPLVGRAAQQDTGGRQPIHTDRPQARVARRGSGKQANTTPATERQRYPKGHPKAGTFIPQSKAG